MRLRKHKNERVEARTVDIIKRLFGQNQQPATPEPSVEDLPAQNQQPATPEPSVADLLVQIRKAINQESRQLLLDRLIDIAANQQLQELDLSRLGLTRLSSQIGNLSSLTSLILNDNQITVIPETIGNLSSLTSLHLDNNRISVIPETIGNLSSLTSLHLYNNQIAVIPETIGKLSSLTSLILNNNYITAIPETIGKLTNLTKLLLDHNQIAVIPEAIGKLTNLTSLHLYHNQITVIPETIGNLSSLTALILDNNQIAVIPETIGKLTNLVTLSLNNNQIAAIPETIGKLTKLVTLSLNNNQIASLPQSLKSLQDLRTLNINGNPILKLIPPEIVVYGLQSILSFYFQTQDGETEIIYEAKFIIVGEGDAGKTTLAKKLQDREHKIDPAQKSTEGIDIIQWKFSLPGKLFRVNIWDFGGQEIMHATHQFFLTERSLYTLVVDNRRENPNLYYWLNVVDLLSNNSPIFILKNEKQDRRCEVNEGELRGEFINLKDSVAANLANNNKLTDIHQAIQTHIEKLPHLNIPIPKIWARIRIKLEQLAQEDLNYINIEAYYNLCESYGIKDRKVMLEISKYFHDLGICLHFQDDPILKRQLILKPTWATNAVYKVVHTKTVIDRNGHFTKQDLQTIWYQPEYADMHYELLQLMQKFKICYPISDNTYIAPSLLPLNKPEYDWEKPENLIFRYKYDFMPKGILTAFIVAIHDLIEQSSQPDSRSQLVWRTGVILTNNGARAEVIESYDKREICIRVVGFQPKDLLTVIRHEFKKIHGTYKKRLKYQELVPCNCHKCDGTQSPEDYPLEVLEDYRKSGDPIQCRTSRKMVDVQRLINGIESERVPDRIKAKISQGELRQLVDSALTNDQFSELCCDIFPEIHNQFTTGQSKSDRIISLVIYVMMQGKIDELLDVIKVKNPNMYAEFQQRDRT